MRTVSLRLPTELDQRVTALAEKRGTSRSVIVREALEAYANGHAESVTALAGDLVGSIDGPKDLSTAAEHLEGYGR
jgi:predicted DNA-binding protein